MDQDKISVEHPEVVVNKETKRGRIHIRNSSGSDYGFKIKSTHSSMYLVKPSIGVIEKSKDVSVSVELLEKDEDVTKHKFLVQLVPGTKNIIEENLQKIFSLPGIEKIEKKLSVRYAVSEKKEKEAPQKSEEKSVFVLISALAIGYYLCVLMGKLIFGF